MSDTDVELLASSLRADEADLRVFVEALAAKLENAFPGHCAVDRKGGLFGGDKRVRRIKLQIGDDEYELEHDDGRVGTRRRTVVRGIALKNDELPLDEWIERVSRAVVEQARESERGRAALARLLGA
jgi:hypothetical protein